MLPIEATVWKDCLPAGPSEPKLGLPLARAGKVKAWAASPSHSAIRRARITRWVLGESCALGPEVRKAHADTVPERLLVTPAGLRRTDLVKEELWGHSSNPRISGANRTDAKRRCRVPCPLHCCSDRGHHRHQLNMRFLLQRSAYNERRRGI